MKATIISASPRKTGNTITILAEIERGIKEEGFETKSFILHESSISYCIGCKSCYNDGVCVHNDDVHIIAKEIFDSQLVIVASPSYWGDVTAQLKTFIDRCTPYCDTNTKRKFVPKDTKGIAVAIRAGSNKAENENLVNTIEHFLGHLNIPLISSFTVEEVDTSEDLANRPEILTDAYAFGKSIIQQKKRVPLKNYMEQVIRESLAGDAQKNALEFAAFLDENGISCERPTTGYWADKIYFICSYNEQSVCFISINEYENNSWCIMGDDSGDAWYENTIFDEHIKEIAWQNIDICTDYSSCRSCGNPGKMSRKKIFGKEFDNVCPVTLKFTNPDAVAVECMKKVFEARKNYILNNAV